MAEIVQPRWGAEGRNRKAFAILSVLRAHCGHDVTCGAWLDVGCGSGGIAAALAGSVEDIVGVDPEPWPQWAKAMQQHTNLRFVTAAFDDATPPLPQGSVQVAVCNQVYEHVGDVRQLIRNLAGVLAPRGICYFAGPNLLWPIEPHVFWPFVHWLPRSWAVGVMRAMRSRRAEELDANSLDFWRLRSRLQAAGFRVEPALVSRLAAELQLRGWPRLGAAMARLPRWVERLGVPFAPGFVFVLWRGPVRE